MNGDAGRSDKSADEAADSPINRFPSETGDTVSQFGFDVYRVFGSEPVTLDFIVASSYHKATRSSGEVRLTKDLDTGIEGRHVMIVEDIVDTGLTLTYLQEILRARGPKSIKTACLLSKPSRREVDVPVDYIGFTIEDRFVIGYGLDYAERYRNLPYIGVLHPDLVPGGH